MPEIPYTITSETLARLPLKEVPGSPGFKWTLDDSRAFEAVLGIFNPPKARGVEIASYALPWTLHAISERVFYGYVNPKWGILDLIGGRLNPLFEWPPETFIAACREASEEVGATFLSHKFRTSGRFRVN